MQKEYIDNCSLTFHYGTIHDSVRACSFLGDEEEKIDFQTILKELHLKSENQFLYFFTGQMGFYPMCFQDKKLGLWKNIGNTYGINIVNCFEKTVMLNRFYLLFGIADITGTELENVFPILQKADRNAFVFLTNRKLKSLEDFSSYMEINERNSNYRLHFNAVINAYCRTPNDILITAIQGYNGFSVNLFSGTGKTGTDSAS